MTIDSCIHINRRPVATDGTPRLFLCLLVIAHVRPLVRSTSGTFVLAFYGNQKNRDQ